MCTSLKAIGVLVLAVLVTTILSSSRPAGAQDKPTAPASSTAAGSAASSATGTWKWTFQGFGGNDVEVTLKLKQVGEKVTGTISGIGREESEIQDGMVKDGNVTFKVFRDFGGNKSITTYTAKLADGTLKGKSEMVIRRDFEAKLEK